MWGGGHGVGARLDEGLRPVVEARPVQRDEVELLRPGGLDSVGLLAVRQRRQPLPTSRTAGQCGVVIVAAGLSVYEAQDDEEAGVGAEGAGGAGREAAGELLQRVLRRLQRQARLGVGGGRGSRDAELDADVRGFDGAARGDLGLVRQRDDVPELRLVGHLAHGVRGGGVVGEWRKEKSLQTKRQKCKGGKQGRKDVLWVVF